MLMKHLSDEVNSRLEVRRGLLTCLLFICTQYIYQHTYIHTLASTDTHVYIYICVIMSVNMRLHMFVNALIVIS